ncbi:MAG: DEAD/DEAH box helicase family protein, partial [Thaumarchaeota archaeon]|nr:DEAD/DEAH box helicase family protein [Nitrososphaerota archaeon]
KSFIKSKEKDRLIIDRSKHFELLAALIKDGILPFMPQPVDEKDMVNLRCDFELRDYQKDAWKYFLQYSNIGAFFPPSTGKTYLSIYTMTRIKGPHLVVCPSKLLVEQWIERIELYTDLRVGWWDTDAQRKHVMKELEEGRIDVIVCTYQSAIKHCHDIQFQVLTIDEVHHLPANEFSKLAVIKKRYTLGLSATPQREDQREEYIFALTGKPVGLSWDKLKNLGIIQSPTMHVWIVKNEQGRISKLAELLQEELKTIIFCDSIEMGKAVSKRFGIPHVYGNTKQRLDVIQEALVSVVSRVGDEGVSLPDIKRVIEIDYLFGSRRQELQRFTRLLHGKSKDGEGHLIMTIEQYQHDHKRLFGIMDKGFKIVLHREGISEKVI